MKLNVPLHSLNLRVFQFLKFNKIFYYADNSTVST